MCRGKNNEKTAGVVEESLDIHSVRCVLPPVWQKKRSAAVAKTSHESIRFHRGRARGGASVCSFEEDAPAPGAHGGVSQAFPPQTTPTKEKQRPSTMKGEMAGVFPSLRPPKLFILFHRPLPAGVGAVLRRLPLHRRRRLQGYRGHG